MLSPYHPLQLVLGLSVWALWLVLMYGTLGVACAVEPPLIAQGARTWLNGVLLVITLLTTSLLLYWARQCWHTRRAQNEEHTAKAQSPPHRLIIWLAIYGHAFAALTTFSIGLMVLFFSPCL